MDTNKDNKYSIGDAAKLLGVTVQTLRHYSKIGLLEPAHINPETGYRYYSYSQLSLIDRIRYLQSLGLSLNDIKTAFEGGHGRGLVPFLEKQLQDKQNEFNKLKEVIDALQWYIHFFCYPDQQQFQGIPYKRFIDKRYILAVPWHADDPIAVPPNHPVKSSLELRKIKTDPLFEDVLFLRQNGNIIDFKSMLQQEWMPLQYFIYLKGDPGFKHPNIIQIPAGEYLCFQGRPLINEWDTSYIRKFYEHTPVNEWPVSVIADEYEDSLSNFTACLYEFQILIRPSEGRQNVRAI